MNPVAQLLVIVAGLLLIGALGDLFFVAESDEVGYHIFQLGCICKNDKNRGEEAMKATIRHLSEATLGILLLGITAEPALAQKKNPLRDVFFGETHIHTSWSFDAYVFGNS